MDSLLAESWLKIEAAIGQRPSLSGDVFDMRAQYKALGEQGNANRTLSPHVTVENKRISSNVALRTYTPTNVKEESKNLPVGLYFHGGGFCCGDLDSEDTFCRDLAERLPCVVVSVDYRLAPEHKAPAQVDDALEAWNWAYNNAATLNGDRAKFFTVGQSAGGNLALTLVRRLVALGRKHEVKSIAAVIPFGIHPEGVPTHYKDSYRSFDEHAESPVSTKHGMKLFYDAIQASPNDPDVYVINAGDELRHFPPTYFGICGIDPLRDDGLIIKDALEKAGVPVKHDLYEGLPHGFWAFGCPPPSGDFTGDVVVGIRSFIHA